MTIRTPTGGARAHAHDAPRGGGRPPPCRNATQGRAAPPPVTRSLMSTRCAASPLHRPPTGNLASYVLGDASTAALALSRHRPQVGNTGPKPLPPDYLIDRNPAGPYGQPTDTAIPTDRARGIAVGRCCLEARLSGNSRLARCGGGNLQMSLAVSALGVTAECDGWASSSSPMAIPHRRIFPDSLRHTRYRRDPASASAIARRDGPGPRATTTGRRPSQHCATRRHMTGRGERPRPRPP
jgi:hypothetical protein